MSSIRNYDPLEFDRPETMDACINAKEVAYQQLILINAQQKRLRKLKKSWKQRYSIILNQMGRIVVNSSRREQDNFNYIMQQEREAAATKSRIVKRKARKK